MSDGICDRHGVVIHENCKQCGAPQCCWVCCNEARDQARIAALELECEGLRATINAWSKPVAVIKGSIVNGYVIHRRHVGDNIPDGPATVRVFTDPAALSPTTKQGGCGEPDDLTKEGCPRCGTFFNISKERRIDGLTSCGGCGFKLKHGEWSKAWKLCVHHTGMTVACATCDDLKTIPTGIRGIEYRACPDCAGKG